MKEQERLLSELSELRSRIKKLEENEIRLKKAEEELKAANQQLDASNQQLAAGEQQLRAINQQLQANELELRKNEIITQEAREFAENIIATVREPLVILDKNLRIISVNRFFLTTFQVTYEETEGKHLYELGNKQWNIPSLKELLKEILPKKTIVEDFEIEHNFEKIGRKIMQLNARELRQKKSRKKLILLSIQDITYRKKREQKLQMLNTELEAKRNELQQLLYITTHDLRSPLVNIQGFNKELEISIKELNEYIKNETIPESSVEKYRLILEEEIPEAMHFISSSAAKMDALLTGLLVLSRLERQKSASKELDMDQLITLVLDDFQFEINKHQIEIDVSNLPHCYGDELQINQLFSNLIGNAMKFFSPERPGKIKISGGRENNFSKYIVEDNGIGIHPNYQEKVFELFHKLDPKKPGIGLGMNIVKQIIEKNNGKIELESEPDVGTKFSIFLPIQNLKYN